MKRKTKAKPRPPFAKLGDVLKHFRTHNARMSQQELADALSVHVQFVSNWERGLCAPPHHCHAKLAKVLRLGNSAPTENMQRERIWEALMDDYGHDITLKYGGLI